VILNFGFYYQRDSSKGEFILSICELKFDCLAMVTWPTSSKWHSSAWQ